MKQPKLACEMSERLRVACDMAKALIGEHGNFSEPGTVDYITRLAFTYADALIKQGEKNGAIR